MMVEYVAHSGSDLLVVDAARASFGKQSELVDGVLSERDRKLIRFLAREGHVLPFRHPSLTLRCKAPVFVARQLMKHQVGMSWSEESRRYVADEPEFFWPEQWRARADNVKQGSSDEEWDGDWQRAYDIVAAASDWYRRSVKDGLAPELARMVLPQNMVTTWVWTGTLLAWTHFLGLRLAADSQQETREFAGLVEPHVRGLFPVSVEALLCVK